MKGFSAGVMLRGAAMGAADIVPGVSGGTVTPITEGWSGDEVSSAMKRTNRTRLQKA